MNTALEKLTGLVLLDPWFMLLLLLVPLGLLWRRRRGVPAVVFAPAAFLRGGPRSWRVRFLPLPRVLQVVGLALAALALARPVHRTPLPLQSKGIDIYLCLDTSSSMASKDLDPRRTRLDVARDAAARFLAERADDRIGLISFARYPDLRCPLTLDHAALGRFLGEVHLVEREGPEDVTGIGTAVARAAQLLGEDPERSRVVILLTDGAENVATAQTPDEIGPLKAGRICEALGIRVYVIAAGVGSTGPGGQWTAIDTARIQRLAEISGGRFFEARDASAVNGVYASIDLLEKVEREEPRYEVEDRFLGFLIAAAALLLAARFLRSTLLEVLP